MVSENRVWQKDLIALLNKQKILYKAYINLFLSSVYMWTVRANILYNMMDILIQCSVINYRLRSILSIFLKQKLIERGKILKHVYPVLESTFNLGGYKNL